MTIVVFELMIQFGRMWLIRTALRRPYTFVVMALLIVIGGVLSFRKTPTDLFPAIDVPVIAVIWSLNGLPPEDMERRIVTPFERNLTTVINDIEHIESQTLTGVAVVKLYLRPGGNVEQAIAQTTAMAQAVVRTMPPGAAPPMIVRYSVTDVPVMQLALASDSLSEQQLRDLGIFVIRAELLSVSGAQIPNPYGGKVGQIMVDIDPKRLHGSGLSPRDVQVALSEQNVVAMSGTIKLGTNEYPVRASSSPEKLEELAGIPIKTVNGITVFLRDVANVRNGNIPQESMVHVEGRRSVLFSIYKDTDASTLDVAAGIRNALPRALERLPAEAREKVQVKILFDQSLFVQASINGVMREAMIALGLTALLILMFLGSWRSMLTVVVSIPLSILFAIIMLHVLGHTLNVMTLGGLALAVGILVDDATVEIENIHRNLAQRKTFVRAITDGAQQIAIPAFVSTLCICIVFAPIAFLDSAARSMFMPMALAVVFAMLMSYLLSRTLVPTLVHYLLAREVAGSHVPNRFSAWFERAFDGWRMSYGGWLAWSLQNRLYVIGLFTVFVAGSLAILPMIGRDYFPSVDAGLIKLHVRGVPGTRLEESEKRIAEIQRTIRTVIPSSEIETMLDVLGTPYSFLNLARSEGTLISTADGQIMLALRPGHRPTRDYVRALRKELRRVHPETTFFFLAPDVSSQVLNFGLASPFDIQVDGPIGSEDHTLEVAQQIAAKVAKVPGAVDVHLAQVVNVPQLRIDVDRTLAGQAGVSQRNVSNDMFASLSSNGQVSPSYWLDKRGNQYSISVQTPQPEVDSFDALRSTPISTGGGPPQTLGNLAKITRTSGPANITHYNTTSRMFDIQANVEGTDLGTVADAIDEVVAEARTKAPKGTRISVKGQAQRMNDTLLGLRSGLVFAILLVYLVLVVNFQSWLDPFIILMALPGALAGMIWILFLSATTLSVPALIGSIMCIGVSTANSVLVVSFANEQRATRHAADAALAAGMTRLRPVLMTALAMIAGMVPMAIGVGEGAEHNAPLGRVVIGGLTLATATTLFVVPVLYSLLRRRAPVRRDAELG